MNALAVEVMVVSAVVVEGTVGIGSTPPDPPETVNVTVVVEAGQLLLVVVVADDELANELADDVVVAEAPLEVVELNPAREEVAEIGEPMRLLVVVPLDDAIELLVLLAKA